MATLHLKNVTKTFGTVEVLKRIDLDIADGEFVVFVGPSGCGKSTLLRMIAGLEEITGGDLFIDDERCNEKAPKDRGIAMVFQSYALYPHRTVYGNMAFGLRLAGHSRAEIDAKIQEAAGILRMEHLLDRRPSQLSGGQRQRVAIGRAIVRNPRVFLFDEPLSNLDAALRVSMRRELAKLHGQLRATMIYVTHDQVEAMTLADRIVVLDGGVAQQIGPPLELYNNPANLFVAGFIGSPRMNFLEGTIARGDSGETRVRTADAGEFTMPSIKGAGAVEGAAVTVGVRPEHMTVSGASGPLIEGRVALTEQLGDQVLMEIATAGGNTLIARTAPADVLPTGSRTTLTFDTANAHLFDETGRAFLRR